MAFAFYMDVPIDEAIYARVREKVGEEPPKGLIMHLVVKRDDGLRYIDVWESKAAFEQAFEGRIHSKVHEAFEEVGFQPDDHVQPEQLEIVHLWTPIVALA